jgi:hypothetical protein
VGFLAVAVLTSVSAFAADCQVERHGDLVSVRAHAVPLSEVLDVLSERTGMKVVYEGNRPSARLSLDLRGLTLEQVVLRVLEGQGVDYVAQGDRTGRTVEILHVAAHSSRASLPSATEWRSAAPTTADPMSTMLSSTPDESPAHAADESAAPEAAMPSDPMTVAVDPMTGAAAAMPEVPAPWKSPFDSAPAEATVDPADVGGPGAGPGAPPDRRPPGHPRSRRPSSEKWSGDDPARQQ